MRGKTAVGAGTTQAYQMLAVSAACAGLAFHKAVRELTAPFGGRKHPTAQVQRSRRIPAFETGDYTTRGLVGDEIKRP